MYQSLTDKQKKILFNVIVSAIGLLAVFLAVMAIDAIKGFTVLGHNLPAGNTITINGTGEVLAVPDIATFSFSVTESAKLLPDAQDAASKKMNSVISALKALGIAEKDIQTTNYSSYPKYEYQNAVCPTPVPMMYPVSDSGSSGSGSVSSGSAIYCPPGKSVLTGYEVDQTVTVKIRKTADAGNILAKIGSLNVSNISGLSFTVDNIDAVQAQARDKAIADAKSKASVLSKSLGVKLNHIVNFSENGNYPMPYLNMKSDVMSAGGTASVAPQIPTGENKITSNVSITYEIR